MSDLSMRCAMTGIGIRDAGDGVWDDGEWISWAYINRQIEEQENGLWPVEVGEDDFEEDEYEPSVELLNRIHAARNHREHTLDKISPDWGRIGEDYLAERFAVQLCKDRHAEGHDGRSGNDLIEIKTITPHKRRAFVQVKRAGNFSVLAVVRVTDDYRLEGRFVRRDRLPPGDGGKYMIVSWRTACRLGREYPPRAPR